QHAEVDQGGERDGGPGGAAPVVVDGGLVVAVQVVDVGQLEQGAGVVAVDGQGLLELGRGGAQVAVDGQKAAALVVVLGRSPGGLFQPVEELAGLVDLAGPAEGAGAVQLGGPGVVARLGGGGERVGRLAPPLEVFQRDPAEVVGQAVVAGLG